MSNKLFLCNKYNNTKDPNTFICCNHSLSPHYMHHCHSSYNARRTSLIKLMFLTDRSVVVGAASLKQTKKGAWGCSLRVSSPKYIKTCLEKSILDNMIRLMKVKTKNLRSKKKLRMIMIFVYTRFFF